MENPAVAAHDLLTLRFSLHFYRTIYNPLISLFHRYHLSHNQTRSCINNILVVSRFGRVERKKNPGQCPELSRFGSMAGSRLVARLCSRSTSLSSKLGASSSAPSFSPLKFAAKSNASASAKRIFSNPRLPVELGCMGSMMPLHSAIASARLKSVLSSESQSWGLVRQGNSMPL